MLKYIAFNQLISQFSLLNFVSVEFLGNPVGLVSNLGTGVKDFFVEPAQGIIQLDPLRVIPQKKIPFSIIHLQMSIFFFFFSNQ